MTFESIRRADRGTLALWVTITLAFVLSFWLRRAFPVHAIGTSSFDDLLFIRLAEALRARHWLGDYDNLTMAKGAAYSAFLAVNHALGIPLKISEHLVYLLSALYFSRVAGRQFASRALVAILFVLLAFNPVFWAPEVGGRVVRENLYITLTLLLAGLGIRVFVERSHAAPREQFREKRWHLAALGVVGALFWLTREEGLWIAPAMAVLAGYWIFSAVRTQRRPVGAIAAFVAVPVACFTLVVGAVDAKNYARYGVFRNNDFRSSDFQSAYGALARIRHDRFVPYVVFPKDARARAYSVSAAARELQPYFEGKGDEMWRQVSCDQTRRTVCPEILSGWFMWAFRESVAAAGHYVNAVEARAFYRRLAREINEACDREAIPCGPRHDSLVPPWHPSFPTAIWSAALDVLPTVAALGDPKVYISPTNANEEQLRVYRTMTHEPVAIDTQSTDVRIAIARHIATLETGFSALSLPVSIVGWIVLIVLAVRRKQWHDGHMIVAALAAGVAGRTALLVFLEATSIPSNNALYPSPATPLMLALGPCVLWLAFRTRKTAR